MPNIVNLMNHLVSKESQIGVNKDDISTLKTDLNKTDFTVKVLQNDFETKGKSFERGLIFYGYPTDIDNLYEVDLCVPRYSQFDVVVLADGVQKTTHEDHNNCKQIISKVRLVHNTKFFGYVPIGCLTPDEDEETEGSNRPMEQLKQDVLDWIEMGVQGIFLDEFGYDYRVTRDRQNEIVKFCHDHDLVVIANSWDCDYCFSDEDIVLDFDPVNGHHGNPNKLHSELSAADYILFEHALFNATSSTKEVATEPWDVYRIQQYYEDYYQTFKTKVFMVNSLPSKASQEVRDHIVRTTTLAGVVMQADCVGVSTEFWNSENNTSYMCKDIALDRSNSRFIDVKMAKKSGKEIPVKYTTKVGDDEYCLIWNATKETDKTFSVDKFYCTVNGLTDTELYPTYDKLDAKIKELKAQLENLEGNTIADLNGDYTITSGGTYILTLKSDSTLNISIPENSSTNVIIKQTGDYAVKFNSRFSSDIPRLKVNDWMSCTFENYGSVLGKLNGVSKSESIFNAYDIYTYGLQRYDIIDGKEYIKLSFIDVNGYCTVRIPNSKIDVLQTITYKTTVPCRLVVLDNQNVKWYVDLDSKDFVSKKITPEDFHICRYNNTEVFDAWIQEAEEAVTAGTYEASWNHYFNELDLNRREALCMLLENDINKTINLDGGVDSFNLDLKDVTGDLYFGGLSEEN